MIRRPPVDAADPIADVLVTQVAKADVPVEPVAVAAARVVETEAEAMVVETVPVAVVDTAISITAFCFPAANPKVGAVRYRPFFFVLSSRDSQAVWQ